MSYYHMIDVSDKLTTKRVAIASGKIYVGEIVFNLIKAGQMIKGDPLRLAEIAAIMGAKSTSNLIPLCHPLGLDKVEFISELIPEEFAVLVYCVAITSHKTGVEMEALSGVSAGLLTIYDLSKISEPSLTIGDIHLVVKIGGKSGVWINPQVISIPQWIKDYLPQKRSLNGIKCATITLSDRASQGIYVDKSGQLLNELLLDSEAQIISHQIIPDDVTKFTMVINQLLNIKDKPDLIITTGSTGLSPRDIAPDVLLNIGGREIPGIGELLRLYGSKFKTSSYGSRSVAIMKDSTIIIALPGSTNAVAECFACLIPILEHLVKMSHGEKHA